MRGKLVFALSLFVLLCSLLCVRFNSVEVKSSNGYPVAPDFILTDIDGNEFTLSLYRGKVVLLDFFATWCTPSVNQFYHLMNLHEEFDEKLVLISISPENETILRDFREAYSINWTIAEDISDVFDMYNVSYTPTLVIINRNGCIRYRHVGLTEESLLRPEIESLLPKTIYVDDNNAAGPWNGTKEHPYQNITSGVEHASDNDTVFVRNGTYYEHVAINESISLIGENRDATTIDGNKTGDGIQVGAENVAISGFTIRNGDVFGWHAGWGVYIRDSSGCRVLGNNVIDNKGGICVEYGSSIESVNCTIKGNVVNNNFEGISLYRSNNCIITGNNVSNSRNSGIYLFASSRCTIIGNQIENTRSYGIYLRYLSDNNTVYHNNFIDNGVQASVSDSLSQPRSNVWDNGLEGNYWSNYTGVDLDHDGIGDSWHEIDENNTDQCPLMGMFSDFTAASECYVQTICNSSISDFQFNGTAISFDVVGENGTSGFCRICIPRVLIDVTYRVFVNGTEILPPPLPLPCSNSTHSYLYFNYNHSTQEVIIISEFPSAIVLSLFMIVTLLAVIVYQRKHSM